MGNVDPRVEGYMRNLVARYDEPVLLEMEAEGEARDFPIVGRLVGVTLELLARSIGARRVFELGSGFGYSAYWFCRAVGPDGEVHCTDGNAENEKKTMDYLGRAELADRVRYHVGDALEVFEATPGEFDVVFCDIDKQDYPRAWEAARERIRLGGLWICDNAIGAGGANVVTGAEGRYPEWRDAIDRHNRAVAEDERFVSVLLPLRDGDLVALRTS